MVRQVLMQALAATVLVTACGPKASTTAPAPATPPVNDDQRPTPTTTSPVAAAKLTWKNPGGMWLPRQLAAQADTLRALGLELDPSTLGDPTAATLGAVVSLGGCTGTFVSAEGLVVTNHHCVQGALQYNATPEANLIETGFLASSRGEEKWAGPTQKLYVAQKFTDVTAAMTEGLAEAKDDLARTALLEAREKGLLAACEKDRPELRCKVASFFSGAEWTLIEQLEIRDVRLVYAPARGIGNFGGEVDNWRWPRHTGDFSFYRAYVGKDGKPADHADDNVPFRPAHFVKVARAPLRDGDFVMVAGYPGSTRRLASATQVREAAEWRLPRSIALNEQYLGVLAAVSDGKPELAIKAETKKRGLNNYLTKYRGQLETMTKGGLVEARSARDAELRAWIAADPERSARFQPALDKMAALEAERLATRDADVAFGELAGASALLDAAMTIVRNAEERGKPDAARELGYQERDQQRQAQAQLALDKRYARPIDRAVLEMFVQRALALPAAQQPALLTALLGGKRDAASISAALDRLYAGTKLEDSKVRIGLLQKATPAQLARSKDPFIKLALAALPEVKRLEQRDKADRGAMALVAPVYVAALREQRGGLLAPDANSTLRVTFGTVQPSPKGGRAFTTVTEMLAKATGEAPFDAPAPLMRAARTRQFGPYAADELHGELPVDFMSDVDITNGNSGSSTLNGRGELVGLAFDGTYEGVASDWLYQQGTTRTIHCDIRYTLWIMDAVDGAHALLDEMGVRSAF